MSAIPGKKHEKEARPLTAEEKEKLRKKFVIATLKIIIIIIVVLFALLSQR